VTGGDPGGAAGVADLAALLGDAARLLEGAEAFVIGEVTEWRLDGVAFAAIGPSGAEFRLRRDVAAVVLRTPQVAASPRGAGWIRFVPRGSDASVGDRARAWLESAWRLADDEAVGEAVGELEEDSALDEDPECEFDRS
jgi:hypothetical protein